MPQRPHHDIGRSVRQPARHAHRRAETDTDDVTRSLSATCSTNAPPAWSRCSATPREQLNEEFECQPEGHRETLAERGQSLIGEFQTRAEALDTGTQKLNAALEARARQINDTLVERASGIAATFTGGREQFAELSTANKSKLNAEWRRW